MEKNELDKILEDLEYSQNETLQIINSLVEKLKEFEKEKKEEKQE